MTIPIPNAINLEERAIDHTLAQWVLKRTGNPLLSAAAQAASRAEGLGHSCARLIDSHRANDFDTEALNALHQHPWVGNGTTVTPFVLDAQNDFYLWRNWQHESLLADAIIRRCANRHTFANTTDITADLDALFTGVPIVPSRSQRTAVAAVLGTRFFVLTGGPGTGKTTTVLRMLLMLIRHAKACGLPAEPTITLAAPTGKAAQRLLQAIASGKAELQRSFSSSLLRDNNLHRDHSATDASQPESIAKNATKTFCNLLPLIPHANALTLHRLLGFQPRDNSFSRGPRNPLAEDIVVVDETSMVDLAMMRQLLDALRPDAMLILLGDPGQLASVDAGSVLADIVASSATKAMQNVASDTTTKPFTLSDHVFTLDHSWRASSDLRHSIEVLRHTPDPAWLDTLLRERSDGGLQLRHCTDIDILRTCVDGWIDQHAGLLQTLFTSSITPAIALQQLHQMQVLCALRDGPFGAQGLNELFARRLATRFDIDTSTCWYHGRPVIITRNDYARGLFNGDVGMALDSLDGLRVWFDTIERDGSSSLRSYSPRSLPAHESAWAITIHRSQGSEYHDIAVVLPTDAENRVLTRELIYTAVSRAKNHAEIWATDDSLRAALAQPIQRQGGLREKLDSEVKQGHITVEPH